MKNQIRSLFFAGAVAALCATETKINAQDATTPPTPPDGANRQRGSRGGGNFNIEEYRQRMMDRMREQFDVKEDDAWKLISERITKVSDAQRETRAGIGGGRPPGGGGDPGGGRPNPFGGTPNPDAEALQKAIEAKAPAEEIKPKLAKLRESRKAAEAKLEQAQKDLLEVLTPRQEAVAVMFGLLK